MADVVDTTTDNIDTTDIIDDWIRVNDHDQNNVYISMFDKQGKACYHIWLTPNEAWLGSCLHRYAKMNTINKNMVKIMVSLPEQITWWLNIVTAVEITSTPNPAINYLPLGDDAIDDLYRLMSKHHQRAAEPIAAMLASPSSMCTSSI